MKSLKKQYVLNHSDVQCPTHVGNLINSLLIADYREGFKQFLAWLLALLAGVLRRSETVLARCVNNNRRSSW